MCLRLVNPSKEMCTTAGMGKETDYICQTVETVGTVTVLLPILPLKAGSTRIAVQLWTEYYIDEVVQEIRVEVSYHCFQNFGRMRQW